MLTTEDDLQGSSEQAWKLQIEETIKSHFARQRELRKHGVKVLSLFFIDEVAKYRENFFATAGGGRMLVASKQASPPSDG